jgi:plasmid stabilization system protein ParE
MSSRKATPVTLAPRARQDFIDILRYTGETWGQAQLLTYRDKINDALQVLGGNPQLAITAMIYRRRTMPIWSGHM